MVTTIALSTFRPQIKISNLSCNIIMRYLIFGQFNILQILALSILQWNANDRRHSRSGEGPMPPSSWLLTGHLSCCNHISPESWYCCCCWRLIFWYLRSSLLIYLFTQVLPRRPHLSMFYIPNYLDERLQFLNVINILIRGFIIFPIEYIHLESMFPPNMKRVESQSSFIPPKIWFEVRM